MIRRQCRFGCLSTGWLVGPKVLVYFLVERVSAEQRCWTKGLRAFRWVVAIFSAYNVPRHKSLAKCPYMLASEPAQVLAWTEETLRVLCYFFAHACLTSPLTNGDCGNWIFWSAHPGPAKREARLPSRTLDKVRSSRTDYTAREDRRGRRACFCCGGSVAMNSRRRDLRLSAHFGRFRLFGSTGSRALLGWTLSCVVAFLVGRLLSTTSSPRT